MSEVRSHLPRHTGHVSLHQTPGQSKGDPEELATEGCAVHLCDGWRPHPRSRRPWRKRRGYSNWQVTSLHGLCRSAAAIPVAMYLDAGTNNEQYLHEPLYLGMR